MHLNKDGSSAKCSWSTNYGQTIDRSINNPSGLKTVLQQFFSLGTPSNSESSDAIAQIASHFQQFHWTMGEEILSFDPGAFQSDPINPPPFYLILQGKVRVLGVDPVQQRDVSVMLLDTGSSFGTDSLFESSAIAYKVVSASTAVDIAYLAPQHLHHYLPQFPTLQAHLQTLVQQRQTLLFFKTLTALHSVPSHRLQSFLTLLHQETIATGTTLAQSSFNHAGHYWLRQGQIGLSQNGQNGQNELSNHQIGMDWGHPTPISQHWTAITDLQVYRLPADQWENGKAIIPELDPSHHGNSHNNAQSSLSLNVHLSQSKAIAPAKSDRPKGKQHHQGPSTSSTFSNFSTSPISTPASDSSNSAPINARANIFPKPKIKGRHSFWRGYPFIQQQSTADCAVTCLAMIAQYWGKRPSINTLRELADVGLTGTSLKQLAKASEAIGFQARPVRASLDALESQSTPWIAHWQGHHYVVVYRSRPKKFLIADPALGKRTVSIKMFEANWSGYALLLEPTKFLHTFKDKQPGTFSKVLSLLQSYRSLIVQILFASLLIQIFGLCTPLLTQVILDRVVVQKSLVTLHAFALGLVFFGIWKVGLTAVRQYLLDFLSNRLDLTLISGFVSHTLLLPLKFFATRHVGDITTRVQESQKLQRFLTRQVIITWLDACMAFVYVGLMIYYNWKLALLVLGLIPPIVILTLASTPMLRKVSRQLFNSTAKENSTLVEMITGISTVKTNAVEREIRWQWEESLTSMLNSRFGGQKLANNLQLLSGLINTIGSSALLWYGALLVIQEQLTIGQFVAFNMLIGQVINPILAAVKLWDEYQEAVISVERLNDVLSAQPEENPLQPMMVLPPIQGIVRFEQVTFRYLADQDRNTLENISFTAEAGQTIALVGRSGSGKTTFVSLLQGLYHPGQGRICIDGHDIRHVSPQSLRSQLGVVPQDCFLFSGTILDNITLHRPGCSLDAAIDVARLAEAHGFIQALPLGYHTKVGERGATLSGGQRQRIAIARALLGDPKILILDEATSSLDTESERRFQDNLRRFSRDRTTFIIAHRLSTVRHADHIVVLDRGILAEQGTHNELLNQQGIYYHLAHQQLKL